MFWIILSAAVIHLPDSVNWLKVKPLTIRTYKLGCRTAMWTPRLPHPRLATGRCPAAGVQAPATRAGRVSPVLPRETPVSLEEKCNGGFAGLGCDSSQPSLGDRGPSNNDSSPAEHSRLVERKLQSRRDIHVNAEQTPSTCG
jgi:hypothetical protein